jgi:excisionase family DNA binding protein
MEKDLMTKAEVMAFLRISKRTLDKLMGNHEIPFFKLSPGRRGGVRFRRQDIDKWLESKLIKQR